MRAGASTGRSLACAVAAILLVGASPVAGCGEDNGEQATTSPGADAGDASNGSEGSGDESGDGGDDGGVADVDPGSIERIGKPPTTKGGDNSIQEFGDEADAEQTDAVAAVVASFLRAQAKGDWKRACSFTASTIFENLAQLTQGEGGPADCEEFMAGTTGQLPKSERKKLARLQLGSVRVDGERAFAIYKGARGWRSMPMVLEDGNWKVGSLAGFEFL